MILLIKSREPKRNGAIRDDCRSYRSLERQKGVAQNNTWEMLKLMRSEHIFNVQELHIAVSVRSFARNPLQNCLIRAKIPNCKELSPEIASTASAILLTVLILCVENSCA